MSDSISSRKLKCSVCKKSKPQSAYSNRQLKRQAKRICCDCTAAKKVSNLEKSPSSGRRPGDEHLNEISLDGEYYANFNPESSKRELKKQVKVKQLEQCKNNIDNDPLSANNPLGINQHTDNERALALY